MEKYCRSFGVNWMVSLICCVLWIASPTDGGSISELAGSTVILPCDNRSLSSLSLLTWMRNRVNLFTYAPNKPLHIHQNTTNTTFSLSLNATHDYALVTSGARVSDTGNYSCSTTTGASVFVQDWELLITDKAAGEEDQTLVPVVVRGAVGVALLLMAVSWLSVRACKTLAGRGTPPPSSETVQDGS